MTKRVVRGRFTKERMKKASSAPRPRCFWVAVLKRMMVKKMEKQPAATKNTITSPLRLSSVMPSIGAIVEDICWDEKEQSE